MHPAQIHAALAMAGYKQVTLARELGLASNTVSAVINGRSRSATIEARIAQIIGITPEELWPQWHGAGELVLAPQERALVLAWRALSAQQRKDELAHIEALAAGVVAHPAVAVTVHGGIRSAGGDYHEEDSGGRKKR